MAQMFAKLQTVPFSPFVSNRQQTVSFLQSQELLKASRSHFLDLIVDSTLGLPLYGLCPSLYLFSSPPHPSPLASVSAGVQTCLPQIFHHQVSDEL